MSNLENLENPLQIRIKARHKVLFTYLVFNVEANFLSASQLLLCQVQGSIDKKGFFAVKKSVGDPPLQ